MRVAVIGGGVVGLCCAYELRQAGAEVLVLERGRLGQGASLGNGGWVTPSFSYPLPAPGILRSGLAGMLRGSGPLVIHPSFDPTFVRWLLGFRRSCRRERWEHGVRALMALNSRTLELFDTYAAAGVQFEMHNTGLVLVATTEEGLAGYLAVFRELVALGFDGGITEIGPDDAQALEPSLAGARVIGGVHARVDRYVHPESFTRGLATHLRTAGTELREGVDVTSIEPRRGGVRIQSSAGPIDADRAIVAAGAASSSLLTRLGIRLPLVGARGYSLTIAAGDGAPRHALYLAEAKAGVSSFDDSVRIAGVFELGRKGTGTVDRRRLNKMLASVEPYFEHWRPAREAPVLEWSGLRPMTSDGLPLIGRAPALEHVYVATGHGMLGVTLAPATAAALTELITDGRTIPELAPFSPTRRASSAWP